MYCPIKTYNIYQEPGNGYNIKSIIHKFQLHGIKSLSHFNILKNSYNSKLNNVPITTKGNFDLLKFKLPKNCFPLILFQTVNTPINLAINCKFYIFCIYIYIQLYFLLINNFNSCLNEYLLKVILYIYMHTISTEQI